MATSDAQFVFGTNLKEVRKEIEAELAWISDAISHASGPESGQFLGGLSKGITGDVSKAITDIRRLKAEAEQAVSPGGTRAAGTPAVSMQFNDVITGLTRQIEERVRKAALKAGADLGNLDLAAIMRDLDAAFVKRARDEARALIRSVERTGTPQAQAVYGASKDIRTGVPQTSLTTPAQLQQQVADARQADRELRASQRRMQKSIDDNTTANTNQAIETLQDNAQRRGRRQRLAKSEDDLTAANSEAAAATRTQSRQTSRQQPRAVSISPEAAQAAESRRIVRGLNSTNPNIGYATRAGAPGENVIDRTDPNNLRFFREVNNGTGYEEIAKNTPKYVRLRNQEIARLEKQQQDQEKAAADERAARQTYNRRLTAALAAQDPNVGYITKSGTQGKYAFDDPNSPNPRISKNVGTAEQPSFVEVDQSSKDYAYRVGRLQGILADRAAAAEQAAEADREAARRTAELAAAQAADAAALRKATEGDSERVRRGIASGNPSFGYATKSGQPGTGKNVPVVDRSDPANPRFYDATKNGTLYTEVEANSDRYNRFKAQEEARAERQREADRVAAEQAAAARTEENNRLLYGFDQGLPGMGYVTKSGEPGKFGFVGSDAQNPKIYKNVGTADEPDFQEVDQSTREYAHTVRRLVPIMERLGPVWAEQAEAARLEAERAHQLAAEEGLLQVVISARIRQSLMNRTGLGGPLGDNEYDFLTPKGTPSKEVFNPVSKKVYRENEEAGYNEILPTDPEWPRVQRRLEQVMAARATRLQQEGEQDAAAEEAMLKAAKAYATSLDIKARLANPNDASVQYLSDSSRPTARIAVGSDGQAPTPGNARHFERQGEQIVELPKLDENGQLNAKFIESENLLTIQLRERIAAERRAREASDRLTKQLEASTNAAVGAAQAGGGGFGGGLRTGLFSGGFGDNGEAGAYGIGRALGTTVKYDVLYKSFNLLLTALQQVGQEFLNVDDSVVQLQYAMGDGADVTSDFINRLQDVSAPGGFNVGDAMDQASASIRAYRDQIRGATDDTGQLLSKAGQQKLGENIGANFTQAATQIAVLGNTTLDDALQNTRATALGFGLNPLTGGTQVADAVANANFIGGGLPKDITQGGANIAEVASAAGFSLQEALSIISKISADTDESGQLAATRFSRMIGTLQGTSGKNFLTQLNQTLPRNQQIDISASPRDQLVKLLTQVYPNVAPQTQQQIATAVGGQAQQKEFDTLARGLPSIVDQSATPQVGLAAKQYEDLLKQVRDTLGTIKGEVRDIVTNLATSGVLDAFGVALKVVVPILDFIRRLTGFINEQLDKMPDTVKELGGALVGILATLKAISFVQGKGGGSFRQGFKNVLNSAEGIVRPEAQLARGQLTFQNVMQTAEANRALALNNIKSREDSGELGAGAASKERRGAYAAYDSELRAGAAEVKRSAKLGASALEEGGKALEGETKKSAGFIAGWRAGVKPDGIRSGLVAGAAEIKPAIKALAAAIRGGAAQVSVASEEAAVEAAVAGETRAATKAGEPYNPPYAVGGRQRRVAPPAAGAAVAEGEAVAEGTAASALTRGGKIGGFLGGAGRNVLAGAGALLAPEVLVPMIALAAVDGALQVKSTADSVDKAQEGINSTARANIAPGAADLLKAADANAAAAQSMREATSGVSGWLFTQVSRLAGNRPSHAADDGSELSNEQKALAVRLRQQQADGTLATGPAALASQINTATGDDVKSSVDGLLAAGQSASSVLDALALTLKNLKFVATGTVGEMNDLQKTDLAGRMGIAAGQEVPGIKDALQQQIDNATPTFAGVSLPPLTKEQQQRRDDLQAKLDALNKVGEKGVSDTTTNVLTTFFQKNPTAKLTDPKVIQDIQDRVMRALIAQGVDGGSASLAGLGATRDLAAERQKYLAALATPGVAGAFADETVSTAQLEQQQVQSDAKLETLRTGTPDRSVTKGLKVYQGRLQVAKAGFLADIEAMKAAGQDSRELQLVVDGLNNQLTDTQIKILEQGAADAKDTIDTLERRRLALQAGAKSNAEVKAIGDRLIAEELKAAVDSGDPDQIRRVMALASDAEINTYLKQLDDNIAADQAAVDAEAKRKAALAALPKPGDPNFIGPVGPPQPGDPNFIGPVAPGTPDPNAPKPGDPDFVGPVAPTPAQKKLQDDKDRRDRIKGLRGEVTPTGTAATGSDVPGGTPEEKAAAKDAAQAEKDRDSREAAAAKVRAAKAAMDAIGDHSSKEYHAAQEQYYAALNAQADLAQDTAISQAKAALYPGDKVGAAKVAVDDATNNVKRFAKGSKEYWDAVGKLAQAQVDYATAQREQANLIAQTHIDLSDPVAVANQALKDARRKLADDRKNPKVDKGTIAADDIDVANKAAAADNAAFQQRLSDAQTADQLGRTSHATYIRYLQSEHNRLTERLAGMKKGDQAYRQALDQLNEIDKDMKEASNQLTGQFNLGDIKIPSVYEVRRSLQAQAAGLSANAISTTAVANTTTNNVTVNGADFARVTAWLQQIFGKTARITTTPRKA